MAQKSLISIMTTVAAELNLPTPVTVVSNQDQNVAKLLALLRAACDDLLAEFDWQILQTRYSFTTVNAQESYTLPADKGRYISGTFFDANNRWAMQGPKTPAQWEWLKAANYTAIPFTQFRVYNDKIYLAPTPGTTAYTFNFEYISTYYVADGSTAVPKADFTQDSDVCRFDSRLVVYGTKLKFKESIGLDTSSAVADYKRALEFAKGQDTPSPPLNLLGAGGLRALSTLNIPDGSWG